MAKRRRKTAAPRRNEPNPRRKRRHNPRVGSALRSGFGGLNFKKFLADLPATQIGMWAAKWTAKRFSEENIADTADPGSWNYASYIKGGLGTVAAAVLMNMFRPGSGQRALEGGLNLMTFFALRNEVIEGNEWAKGQFGQEDEMALPESAEDMVYEGEDGQPYFLGPDNEYYPADERHRLMMGMMGESLEPIGPMGAILEPVGPLGDEDPYKKIFHAN
jgi:hypothetical protein